MEKRDFTLRCYSISAGKDYPAFRIRNAVNFWQPQDKNDGYTHAVYDIVDEKEK
jgi:hypothetical protein